ncbi:hypothetical protein SEUCBS140593_004936 [Sporothrix eucalyptigena]|uniref:Short-chain dehydrogenase n=1 Tax=Sporothrix eucalyptigena TaxID=1812306 RepID=A0ABP0BSG0_9PEZI
MTTTYTAKTTGEAVARDSQTRIAGRTVLVTGTSPGGLGAAFATTIAPFGPTHIILASHNVVKAEHVAKDIAAVAPAVKTSVVKLDLSSQAQVREAAAEILKISTHIDILVNNAAVMATSYGTTVDGIEQQFGTNHIGHFLLTNLLLPKLLEARTQGGVPAKEPLRVVNVASNGFRFGWVRYEDINFGDGTTYEGWFAYGQSKSANMLFSRSLAEKLGNRGVVSVSLHPGVVITTNLSRSLAMEDISEMGVLDRKLGNRSYWDNVANLKSTAEGVATHVFAAFDASLDAPEVNGSYLEDSHVEDVGNVKSWARDSVDAEKLWKLSEGLVSQNFDY